MRQFFAAVVNGTNVNNTIGNRTFLMGCHIIGDISVPPMVTNAALTDLEFRECTLSPKDPYWSLSYVENSIANTVPAFN